MTNMNTDGRSIPELFSDAFAQLGKLVRNEINLARAEVSDKASQAAVGAGFVFGGLMLLMPALVLCLIAFALFLTGLGFSPVTAHLVAGCLAAIGSAVLVSVGMGRLKPAALAPKVTMDQVSKDAAAAKEMVR